MSSNPNQTAFPRLDTPFVDEARLLEIPWYQLLVNIWQNAGGAQAQTGSAVYFLISQSGSIDVYSASSQEYLGTLVLAGGAGQPALPIDPGVSPFTYTALLQGTMVVFGAEVELSRDNGAHWYKVTLTGGAVPMMVGDQIRVTWTGADPPEVTWFPY